jgi:hypothetical protein
MGEKVFETGAEINAEVRTSIEAEDKAGYD